MELKLLKKEIKIKEMGKFKLLLGYLFINVSIFAQNESGTINYTSASEVNNRIKIPKSPEAEAFEKYGNTPVNLYTGTPEINIPLHTLKGRELDIPISLNYDASGIKVTQIATSAGLGWNLTMGGRISRIASGTPDDLYNGLFGSGDSRFETMSVMNNGCTFNDEDSFTDYLDDFMIPVTKGAIDTLMDYYSLNVLGINDYIIQDINTGEFHTLLNPRIKISKIQTYQWIITGEDGTQYYFDNKLEKTTVSGGDDTPGGGHVFAGVSTTSWLLTKIVSKNKLDTFEFDYKLYTWATGFGTPISSVSVQQTIMCPTISIAAANYNFDLPYKTEQQMPFNIKYNGEIAAEMKYKSRTDLRLIAGSYQGGNALDEIILFDFKKTGVEHSYFKKVLFNHSYFGSNIPSNYKTRRLKLDNIIIFKSNTSDGKKYAFEYDRPALVPEINSLSQDMLGLFNGAGNNSLVPISSATGVGGSRDSNFDLMTIGCINKIIYPTKGYTVFEFEQNKVPDGEGFTYHPPVPVYSTLELCGEIVNSRGDCIIGPPFNADNSHYSLSDYLPSSNFGVQADWTTSNIWVHIVAPRTKYLKITEAKNYMLTIDGRGVYMLQKLPNCTSANDVYCFGAGPNYFNSCMHSTNEIYYNGLTSSHPNELIKAGLTFGANIYENIYLPVGNYQLTVWSMLYERGPGSIDYFNVNDETFVTNTIPAYYSQQEHYIEGFRIKEIRDYSRTNELAETKEYKYVEDFVTNKCSGVQLGFAPEPVTNITNYVSCGVMQYSYGVCRAMPVVTVTSEGISASPNIGYSSVFEIKKNGIESNGFVQTKYNAGVTGLIFKSGEPTSFDPIFENGKMSEKNYFDKNSRILKSEKYSYNSFDFLTTYSFSYIKSHLIGYAKAGPTNYFLENVGGECGITNIPQPADPPSYFSNGDRWYNTELGKYSFILVGQNIKGKFGYLSKKEITEYPNTGDHITTTETYEIPDGEPFKLLNKSKSTSDGAVITENYIYDDINYPNNPEKITDVITTSSTSTDDLFHVKNVYSDVGIGANMVTEIQTAKGTEPLETRIKFDYDPLTKNILTTQNYTGAIAATNSFDSYIFGYNDLFVVAKISGIKYSAIPIALINDIKAASNVEVSAANNANMLNKLNALRTNATLNANFPNAQITTYTYDPVIGVTSQTDPRGNVTSYEYDDLGRLKRTRDKDGNILSENEYHFKN